MALNPVPLAGQSLLVSRDQIANNFTSIDTGFSVNHTAFGAGAGKHSFLTIPAGAAHATLANEVALYSSTGLTSAVPELVFRRNTSGVEITFTESVQAANGWTMLPSGVIIQWGVATIDNATPWPFTRDFAALCVPTVILTAYNPAVDKIDIMRLENTTNHQFFATAWPRAHGPENTQCHYMAIGY